MAAKPGPPASPSARWYALAALALLPLALYARSLGHGFIGLDDNLYFEHNELLHNGDWAGLRDLWTRPFFDDYAPVTQLTIWVDLALRHHGSMWMLRMHHLLWMGLCTLAVFQVMRRASGQDGLAWAVALLYAVHPVCSESALWLAERKNLVAICLSMWSIERHMAWRQGAGRGALLASLVLCPLALLAKVHAVIIPAVISAYEALLVDDRWRRRALSVLPTALFTLAYLVGSIRFAHLYSGQPQEQLGGSLAATVLCDGSILARYLAHAVLPHRLAMFYSVIEDPRRWLELAGYGLLALAACAASIAAVRERRLMGFAWCAAGCSILPAMNLRPIPPMTDHYLQWSLPWLLLALALLAGALLRSVRPQDARAPARLSTLCYALFLLLVSQARVPEYASLASVARAGVLHQPDCAINWSMYSRAEEMASPPDAHEAGRAGIIAYACDDYRRMASDFRISAAISGAVECRRLYGEAASQRLLEKALPLMNEQTQ